MVARAEAIRARTPCRHAPLETTPGANRGSLAQFDAHGANVALTRPARAPNLRAAVSGVLGTTFTGRAACDGVAGRWFPCPGIASQPRS